LGRLQGFRLLEPGFDYKAFKLTKGVGRVPQYVVPLSGPEEDRFRSIMENSTVIDLHEHPVLWPEDMSQAVKMLNLGVSSLPTRTYARPESTASSTT